MVGTVGRDEHSVVEVMRVDEGGTSSVDETQLTLAGQSQFLLFELNKRPVGQCLSCGTPSSQIKNDEHLSL